MPRKVQFFAMRSGLFQSVNSRDYILMGLECGYVHRFPLPSPALITTGSRPVLREHGAAKFLKTAFELSLRRGGCCLCGGGEMA
jgi:hypothetical protein